MAESPVSRRWADFAATLTAATIPPATRAAAGRLVEHALDMGRAHAHDPAVDAIVAALDGLGLSGPGRVIGRPERLAPPWAALVNGAAMHAAGAAHRRDGVVPVLAAASTLGELVDAGPDELVVAVVVGLEISARVATGLGPTPQRRGWDPAGTTGQVGAAAAAATVLGLVPDAWCHAVALATTQVAGHQEQRGTMMVAVHSGRAAGNAVEAALLARRGFTGPARAIEAARGLTGLLTQDADVPALTAALGERWETDVVWIG